MFKKLGKNKNTGPQTEIPTEKLNPFEVEIQKLKAENEALKLKNKKHQEKIKILVLVVNTLNTNKQHFSDFLVFTEKKDLMVSNKGIIHTERKI